MRLAPLGLVLPLFALPLAAQVERLSQSAVTLSLTSSRADAPNEAVELSNGNFRISTPISTVSFGNRQLLELMLQENQLDDTSVTPSVDETSIKNWAIVAVWAAWDGADADSSYRFFARKKTNSTTRVVEVPESLLGLDFLASFVRKNVKLNADDEPTSGTYKYKVYAQVSVGEDNRTRTAEEIEDDVRRGLASVSSGILVGSGRYARPSGTASAIFLPGRVTFTGYGDTDPDSEAEGATRDFVSLSLRIGASSSVNVARYAAFFNAETGTNSRGPVTTAPTGISTD